MKSYLITSSSTKQDLIQCAKDSNSNRHLLLKIEPRFREELRDLHFNIYLAVVWFVYGKSKIRVDVNHFLDLHSGFDTPYRAINTCPELRDRIMSVTDFLPDNPRMLQRLWHLKHKTKLGSSCAYSKCEEYTPFNVTEEAYNAFCSMECEKQQLALDDPWELQDAETHTRLIQAAKDAKTMYDFRWSIPKRVRVRLSKASSNLFLAVVWTVYGRNRIKEDVINFLSLCDNLAVPLNALDNCPALKDRLIAVTSFLPPEAPTRQRWHHVKHNIKDIHLCRGADCTNPVSFQGANFYAEYCSQECKARQILGKPWDFNDPETKDKLLQIVKSMEATDLNQRIPRYVRLELEKIDRKLSVALVFVIYGKRGVKTDVLNFLKLYRNTCSPAQVLHSCPTFKQELMRWTSFLPVDASVLQRWFHVKSDMESKPVCLTTDCGNLVKFKQRKGRYATHCLTCKSKYKYVTLNGKTFKCEGYEHHALNYLAKKYPVSQIHTGSLVPIFKYPFDDKNPRYFPDILVQLKEDWIVEVKSGYTLTWRNEEVEFRKVQEKARAVLNAGYKFILVVFSECGRVVRSFKGRAILKLTFEEALAII